MSDCLIGVHLAYDDWQAVIGAILWSRSKGVVRGEDERVLAAVNAALERAQAAGVA